MSVKVSAIATILFGALLTLLIISMLSISLLGIVDEPQLTEYIKIAFAIGGVLFVTYLIAAFSIKCDSCGERLMFNSGSRGDAKGWDDLFKCIFLNKKVICQHCSFPNDFTINKSSIGRNQNKSTEN